jgi:vitamin B12 transporter
MSPAHPYSGSLRRAVSFAAILFSLTQLSVVIAQDKEASLDEVVVTASRIDTKKSQVASSVTVITNEELIKGQYRSVAEALRQVPGVDIVQSGPVGGNVAAFIRGANSEHTLVLLDGIELNNPATTNRAFNLANLTLENVERIEILRGPQSTLYGSDALGGVINIITKKAAEGANGYISSEAGSYESFTQVGGITYGTEDLDVSAGITRQDVGNISAASARTGNKEYDAYENTSLTGRVAYTPSELLDLSVSTRYAQSGADLDNSGGVGGDDPNRRLKNDEFFTIAQAKTHLLDDTLSQVLSISYSNHDLSDNNDPDAEHPIDLARSSYNGDLLKIDANNNWKVTDYFAFVLGGQTERERASSEFLSESAFGPFEDTLGGRSARTNAVYSEAQAFWNDDASVDLGLRVDDHSIFGRAMTYRIAPAVFVTSSTKLRGTVGNGFKAPSLVQLYSSFGNPNLEAEKSTGWDVGIDQEVCGKTLTVSGSFFRNSFDNLISFNSSTFVLENIARSHTQGVEFSGDWQIIESLTAKTTYTYTESEDEGTGESLLRRPRHKGSITLTYAPTEAFQTYVKWQGYGGRFDNDFSGATPSRVRLGGYGLVDIGASYTLTKSLSLFTRLENLFDKEYETVLGYGNFGAAAFGGVKFSL